MIKRCKWKQIGASLLCLVLALALMLPAAAAQVDGVGYEIRGRYATGARTLRVDISIRGLTALGGRIALGFDNTKLSLTPGSFFSSVLDIDESIQVTGEGKSARDLISQERGHLMFAWYADGAPVPAEDSHLLASVTFQVADGVTQDDFDAGTLRLYSVADGYQGWNTSAWVCGRGMVDYSSCVAGDNDCAVVFDYPHADVEPAGLIDVQVTANDSRGAILRGGTCRIGSELVETDANGVAHFRLLPGTYSCLTTAPGYEDQVDSVQVRGGAVSRTVRLRSMQQLVDDVAADLEIGYQGDDTAEHVTRDVLLPQEGEQNTRVSWTSSDPNHLTSSGSVFRIASPLDVTLTATVEKDGRTAKKTFRLHLTEDTVPKTDPGLSGGGGPAEPVLPEEPEEEKPIVSHFRDVAPLTPWAEESIETMYALGVIKGTGKGVFSPKAPITRADYLTMVMRLFKPQGTPGSTFPDIPSGAYYEDAVRLARGLGIVKGQNGRFNPRQSITRQEMVVMTCRLLEKLELLPELNHVEKLLGEFPDEAAVQPYARDAMGRMIAMGFITGKDRRLAPRDTTTRAEAAVMLCRIYETVLKEAIE